MKVLRAAVIGLGVGERHAAAFQRTAGVELVAICDNDPDKLREVGARLGVARQCTDWRLIAESPEIDVISVCSYDQFHAEQAITAFRCGKHLMIEKPIVLTRAELAAVVRAQQDSGCLLTSNLILRTSPRFKALKEMVQSGAFGEIVAIEGDYIHEILWKITEGWRGKQPFYSVILGGGVHLIDLMRWLLNDEVTEVTGMANKILTKDVPNFRFPDTTMNVLRFRGGALGKTMTIFGPRRPHFHALNLFGTRQSFVNDLPHARLYLGDGPDDIQAMTEPYPAYDKGDLIPDFVAAIRDGRQPNVSAIDVFRVMDICLACIDACERGGPVGVKYVI